MNTNYTKAKRCGATAKTTGKQCGYSAIPGGVVCRFHGGRAPQVKAAAERRLAEAELQEELHEELGRLNIEAVGNPLMALGQLAGEIMAWKTLVAKRVSRLKDIGYAGEYGEQVKAEVLVFERALDRCASVLATIARLNIDERLAAIDAATKLMVIRALEAGLASQGVVGPAASAAKKVAARHLRLLPGGTEAA